MKAFVQHCMRGDGAAVVAARSLRNCHALGLDSIVLQQDNGRAVVRLFVAHRHHTLWHNHPLWNKPLSVGYHAHRFDLSLHVVAGRLTNITAERHSGYATIDTIPLKRYRFYSGIRNGGKVHFELEEREDLGIVALNNLHPGQSQYMQARDIHTVSVDKGQACAWFVYEGRETDTPIPYCWTDNVKATNGKDQGLYKPMSIEEVRSSLALAGLL